MKDKYGIDDKDLMDDIGIACDIKEVMPFIMEEASKVSVIVELGTQYGNGSTKALTWGLRKSTAKDKLMISIDIVKQFTEYRIPKDSWWHFILGSSANEYEIYESEIIGQSDRLDMTEPPKYRMVPSGKMMPSAIPEAVKLLAGRKIDLLFIDSEHTASHVTAELNLWKQYCDKNTKYFFHDTAQLEMFPGYTEAIINFAKENNLLYYIVSDKGQGLSMMTKK